MNTFSPSIVGGCPDRMGLVLRRECVSGSFLGGGDFIGDEAFLLAVPVSLVRILVGVGSFAWLSISAIVSGSALVWVNFTSGFFW